MEICLREMKCFSLMIFQLQNHHTEHESHHFNGVDMVAVFWLYFGAHSPWLSLEKDCGPGVILVLIQQ